MIKPFRYFGRKRIRRTVELKLRLSEAQNHRCPLCGKEMGYDGPIGDRPTFEHIKPLFWGWR